MWYSFNIILVKLKNFVIADTKALNLKATTLVNFRGPKKNTEKTNIQNL